MKLVGGSALPRAVARHLLDRHADGLPDLSGLTVLVPNHRAGQDLARTLARESGRAVLIPPHITPLKAWADTVGGGRAEPQASRLARLHGVLRRTDWLGAVDKWALATELLQLADELSAARLGGAIGARIRALNGAALDRETALIEAVWHILNGDGSDPQACYARALDRLLDALAAAPPPRSDETTSHSTRPASGQVAGYPQSSSQMGERANARPKAIYGYALGPLTALERQFLSRCAERVPVTLLESDIDDDVARTLHQAWEVTEPPLRARAADLARALPTSPLRERVTLAPAPHLEGEARTVAAWVADQLHAGRRALALIALDRETARRVRALLERMEVLIADETGWTLTTTAAAAVVDRWLECIAADFPHVELLDLLKSPFVLGEPAARQDAVLAFELALRRHGVSQGTTDLQRLAQHEFGAVPAWLAALFAARQGFPRSRAPLATWLARLADSLEGIGALPLLGADAAGDSLLETLKALRRDLAGDPEKYGFAEWRRWLNLALESASFTDAGVASPIVLTSLPAARGRLFDAVAVIGADARHLPPLPAPGLFSQAIRAQLGLATATDDATAATADLMQLLVQGPALLSWRAWNDDEPNPASPLVLRLQALHQAAWGAALPEQPPGVPPARASTPPDPTRQPAPLVGAARLPRRYSPTAYQTLLDCPYRFFARGVLGLRELDEADEVLDKSDYGNLLHRILERFHDEDPPLERSTALARLARLSAAEFAALPAFTAAAWASRWEAIQPAYVDAWLEWAGQGWRYQSGETDFAVPVDVAGVGEVTLHGRVDRVDRRPGPGGDARAVIDYKTTASPDLKKKLNTPDEAVQLPFYAWLADAAAAYLPINEVPVAPLALDGETDVAAISLRLPALLEAIAAGAALPAHGVDRVCRHCEARGLCRKGTWHA
ncbi:PD-(D/E)XK nuclease family protein [Thiobacillus sedimenti]|uniref:PD-(D/E)XK nuclease family protein n=1 Tax=Thiobacillus sedimenti TaxID=3110231 RepID=A0ABZ1CJD7_9PROT|nr:PD-(D/E)XK nuclease family protein [Thiobacillus sp. SCUT-2]WRS39319.1 PD-(D/E)XK nuclease family protein [Thiobacillus sp. SCUT-2]